ncbi:hypothetical protein D3OALGA1CA_3121 [Olavius algarvensis associated proteobacterium Delta 3]|nr:hypothetical protein D3OALGA1CA_3121 [Olavius algarvensis associated proteobacterium Delta 3]CAB5158944.1 hypothetical protein D3OALGB2SA_5303 [Olavius algarvensis associated proteobacterium Delta 3]
MDNTTQELTNDRWVWVIVQDPGKSEQIVGLQEKKTDVSFIPFFLEKEIALECSVNMPREPGNKYEVQAIFYGELVDTSAKNDFLLYLLDAEGVVLKKIHPKPNAPEITG